ncbi:hypothetical protein M758_5G031000 [Ceratodon purpureus]|nr:hypothetical protein M758_5G031000 [Ceratodon purpureus]
MVGLEAMKLSGAMLNGEVVGRVLRSRSAKVVQANVAKLVDSKITFKAKKGAKAAVEKEKPSGKREAGAATSLAESGGAGAVEQGKKPRKSSEKTIVVTETISTEVATEGADQGVGASGGSSVVGKVTISSSTTESWGISLSTAGAVAEATKHLIAADTKLAQIIGSHGSSPVWEQTGSCFTALTRSIVYQQLAGKAAAAIYGRLIALCGGPESLTPARITALTDEELRAVGISGRKATYLHDLAEKFTSGFLADEKLMVMNEDDLVTALTAVKGIGVWSAHMFMIFYLHKPDVLPVGDLAIRKGFQKLFDLKQQPTPAEMQELALSWRPYRTLASWYLWRMADIKMPDS